MCRTVVGEAFVQKSPRAESVQIEPVSLAPGEDAVTRITLDKLHATQPRPPWCGRFAYSTCLDSRSALRDTIPSEFSFFHSGGFSARSGSVSDRSSWPT